MRWLSIEISWKKNDVWSSLQVLKPHQKISEFRLKSTVLHHVKSVFDPIDKLQNRNFGTLPDKKLRILQSKKQKSFCVTHF